MSDVRDFVHSLGGCEQYSADFEEQEIDGRALLLLSEDHLINALNIKFSAAIKIFQHISAIGLVASPGFSQLKYLQLASPSQ